MGRAEWRLNARKTRYVPSCKVGARMSLLCAGVTVCPICKKPIKIEV